MGSFHCRWYRVVGWVLAIGTFGFMGGITILLRVSGLVLGKAGLLAPNSQSFSRFSALLDLGFWGMMVLGLLWFFWHSWVMPWFESGDWRSAFAEDRTGEQRAMRWRIYSPALGGLFIGYLLLAVCICDWLTLHRVQRVALIWGFALFAVGTVVMPFSIWLSMRVASRAANLPEPDSLCPACGYDLRGNPDADVCAECGTKLAGG